jgi:hypothetical protein
MRRTTTRVLVLASVGAILALATAPAAYAHEARKVGRWNFDVGWEVEPTYTGYPNAVHLGLNDANDKPFSGLGDTLKVDVTSGGTTTTLAFDPAFEGEEGSPGVYRAALIPTRPGTYAFRIYGTIKGDKIDQTFTCGDTTFDCVKDSIAAEFPAQDPSNAQLATKIGKEAARVSAGASKAKDSAESAKVLGYIGIGLGAVALIVALARGRRPKNVAG